MVSSINSSSDISNAVSQLYTADSTANLVKTTIKTFLDNNKSTVNSSDLVKSVLNYSSDDEDSQKSIADLLKDYASKTSEYIKTLSSNNNSNTNSNKIKNFNQLTKSDYDNAGMSGYYEAQANLKLSKAITAYSLNNSAFMKNSTFKINVL